VAINAFGPSCFNPLYQFWMQSPGGAWQIVQPYSSNATFNWSTAGRVGGTYHFSVWVRAVASGGAAGNSLGRWDAFAAHAYILTSSPCSTATVTATTGGNPVTLTPQAFGCPNPQFQFWMLAPGSSSWVKVQAYGVGSTYDFVTTGKAKGTYQFSVWARDVTSAGTSGNSLGRWDAYSVKTVVVG